MSQLKRAVAFPVSSQSSETALTRAMLEDRRLRILCLLNDAPKFVVNISALRVALEQLGHPVTASRLRVDLCWLAEMGLISITVTDGLTISQLCENGLSVVTGHSAIPGVAKPDPDELQ